MAINAYGDRLSLKTLEQLVEAKFFQTDHILSTLCDDPENFFLMPAPLNTAAEAMAWRLTKVPRNDSQDNLTQADFHTGHDEAIFVLAAPGPQARTHRVDLRQRERRQEHLCANQPVSLGVARSEKRRNATPSSRRRVDGVQVIMIYE